MGQPSRLGFAVSRAASSLAQSTMQTMFMIALFVEGYHPTVVAIAFAVETGVMLTVLPLAGVMIDRFGCRRSVVAADLISFLSAMLIAITLYFHAGLEFVFVSTVLFGVSSAFVQPGAAKSLTLFIGSARFKLTALVNGIESTASIIGPSIGGLILLSRFAPAGFAFCGLVFLFSAISFHIFTIEKKEEFISTVIFEQFIEGIKEFLNYRWLWKITVQGIFLQLFVFPTFLTLGALQFSSSKNGPFEWGVIIAARGVGSIIGDLVGIFVQPTRPLLFSQLLLPLLSLPIIGLLLNVNYYWLSVFSAASSVAISSYRIGVAVVMQEQVLNTHFARVVSLSRILALLFVPVGYTLTIPAAQFLGESIVLSLGIFAVLLCTCGMLTQHDIYVKRHPNSFK